MKLYITYIFVLFSVLAGSAQVAVDSVSVFFRIGQTQFDPAYNGNGASMDAFIGRMRMAGDSLDHIVVRAYASPDGGFTVNKLLPQKRCDAIAAYIVSHARINPDKIQAEPGGIAWDLLRQTVAETPGVPAREKILDVLDNVPVLSYDANGKIIDGRWKRLMEIEGGNPYRWMSENIFPKLRNAAAIALYSKPVCEPQAETVRTEELIQVIPVQTEQDIPKEPPQTTDFQEMQDTIVISGISDRAEPQVEIRTPRQYYFALKTNMLYDAALVPNIAAEFYVGKNISVYAGWMYAWWSNYDRHHYWQIYGGDAALRWWFGKKAKAKPLTGHHLGLYAGALIFDFEWGGTGYMGGRPEGTLWDRCLINSGIEYGYSLPVGSRLNIDFSIGLGYLGGKYIKYFPFDNDYYREKEYNLHYFGPTKAEISLVWLIGRGNRNHRKGGDV